MRPPVVLENGFESWNYAYPHYTASKCEVPEFEETFDMQFTNWIEKSKKGKDKNGSNILVLANKLSVIYPDLYAEIGNNLPSHKINANRTFDGQSNLTSEIDKKSEPAYDEKIYSE